MIANLPLLFVHGAPRGLSAVGAAELERFITFMVTCSWGHDTAREIRRPAWWPPDVPFRYPFLRPPRAPRPPADWELRLKRLVRACYDYHKSAFLLVFSAQLARYPRRRLRYVDNRDRTTSLYHAPSGRLLVTFRNENLFYDSAPDALPACPSPSSPACPSPSPASPACPASPAPADVYLCDHCDSHFDNPDTLRVHERLCNAEGTRAERSGGLPEFLAALRLRPAAERAASQPAEESPHRGPRQGRSTASYDRGPSYPFSSLAGLRSTKPSIRDNEFSRERIERYCGTDAVSMRNKQKAPGKRQMFPVRYRRPTDYWHRNYVHPKQRRKQLLDVNGQVLLLKCRPVGVNVERMSMESMQSYIDNLQKIAAARREEETDKDIEFVSETTIEAIAECEVKSEDPLNRKAEEMCDEVIDLCSDDETPSVKENSDPRAGVTCIMRGGAVLRRTAATPQALPSEPCGAARKRPAAVLQPHPETHSPEDNSIPWRYGKRKTSINIEFSVYYERLHGTCASSVAEIDGMTREAYTSEQCPW